VTVQLITEGVGVGDRAVLAHRGFQRVRGDANRRVALGAKDDAFTIPVRTEPEHSVVHRLSRPCGGRALLDEGVSRTLEGSICVPGVHPHLSRFRAEKPQLAVIHRPADQRVRVAFR
jgi:hypothetical protein